MTNQSVSQKLHENLRQVIAGTAPGARLPSEPALAKELGVSRATLREAMRTFETQGLIRRRQGSGTYVTHPSGVIDSGLEVLESIETMAERIDLVVRLGELKVDHRSAREEEAAALGIESFQEVLAVSRVIMAEDRPVAYLIDTLPSDLLTSEELEESFTGSVLDLILKRGDPPLRYSRTEINAVTAPADIAKMMGIQRGDVLLRFCAQLISTEGRVVDYSFSYFLPGYFRFHVVRRIGKS
jgi:GntR family transcriptional regulator